MAARHHEKAQDLLRSGYRDAAARAEAKAKDSERQARRWRAEADRLRPMAQRADVAGRIADRITTQHRASRAAAAELLPKTPSERRQVEKRTRAYLQAENAKRSTYAQAGLTWDPRTAAGQRELSIEALGHTNRARARLDSLFSRKTDATDVRLMTVERFEMLVMQASSGLYPFPKFEVEGSGGTGRERISGCVEAQREVERLAAHIGREAFALMWVRIIIRARWTVLEGEGIGERRSLSTQFLAAVDATARFFDIDRSASMAAEIARIFAQ